jgi:hypothetical protein
MNTQGDLEEANAATIRDQLRYEISRVLDEHPELNNEGLTHILGYQSAATISKWLNDHSPVSQEGAARLDRGGFAPTSLGISFEELHAYFRRAKKQAKGRPRTVNPRPVQYDVFLASPMAALAPGESYSAQQASALDFQGALQTHCGFTVYFAGVDLPSVDDFDAPDIAVDYNFEALSRSRYFVLLALEPFRRQSGIFVEAGYALALRVPSLYFIGPHVDLPYCLQGIEQHNSPDRLPPVHRYEVTSIRQAVQQVRRHRNTLFSRLI